MTTSPFTENDDFRSLSAGADVAEAGAGNDFVRGLGGHDSINGEAGDDILLGGAGNDTLIGEEGADILTGGQGNDLLSGGTGIDTATYDTTELMQQDLVAQGSHWTAAAGGEGTDTLQGVEIIADASGDRILLVGSGGFATIQAAVDAAVDGDIIRIAAGTYAGDISIVGKALTLIGDGSEGAGATIIAGQVGVTGTMTGKTLSLANLQIDATGEAYGVKIESIGGSVVIDGARIANAANNGVFYAHPANDSQTTQTEGLLEALTITDSVLEDNGHYNGTVGGPGGRGHVNLFGFNGELTLTGNSFVSNGPAFVGPTQPSGAIYKAVTIAGSGRPVGGTNQALLGTDASAGVQDQISPLASAVVTDNVFQGNYTQDLVSFYYFTSIALTAEGNTTEDVLAPWGLLNLDYVGGTVDVSGFFEGASNPAGFISTLQGLATDGSQTGTEGADLIDGRAGVDQIEAGGGNDMIRISQGSAHGATETIDGGEGTDTIVFNPAAADTLTLSAHVTGIEVVSITGPHPTYVTNGTVAANIDASAALGIQAINGNDGANALTGGAGSQTLSGNGGDDTLDGGAGNDSLSGGAGNDRLIASEGEDRLDGGAGLADLVVLDGAFAEYSFTLTGGGLLVTRAGVTQTLLGVERLSFDDASVVLVDGTGVGSGLTTIQAGVNAASSGQIVLVADGTYAENVVIGTDGISLLSMNGAEATIIAGNPAGAELGAVQFSPGRSDVQLGALGHGFTIQGLNGNGAIEKAAVYLQGAQSGHVIQGNEIVAQGDLGLLSEFGYAVTDLTIDSNIFSGQTFAGGQPQQLGGFGNQFDVGNNLPRQLVVLGNGGGSTPSASNGVVFTNNQVTGTAGGIASDTGNAFGNSLVTIDVSDAVISGNLFTGVTAGSGAALRARRDGTTITDNTISGAEGAETAGMLVQNQTGSAFSGNVFIGDGDNDRITGMTPGADSLSGGDGGDTLSSSGGNDEILGEAGDDWLAGETGNDTLQGGAGADSLFGGDGNDLLQGGAGNDLAGDRLEGGLGNDTLEAGAGPATLLGGEGVDSLVGGGADDSLDGGAGQDLLAGGGGNDLLAGGEGIDTATYADVLSAADFSAGAVWQVATLSEGTDSLDGVEIVTDGGGARFLLVGAGGFASIGAALAAAEEGDTILLAAGTYAESLTIDKAVTILGPNSGIAGNGARGGEAVITGVSQVTAASGEVVISGVEFRYTGAANTLIGSVNGGGMLRITGNADVTVEDSRFYAETTQGNAGGGGGGRAIYVPTNFGGALTIDANFFGGAVVNNAYSGANWYRGVWSDGTASSLVITGNSFEWVRSALNLDGYDDAPVTNVSDNAFTNVGSGISLGVGGDSTPLGIGGNVFTNVGTDFNLQNLATPIVFAVGGNSAVAGGDPVDAAILVLGGSAGDEITGGDGIDYLSGNGGDDTLVGGDGADTLSGGSGNDHLSDGGDDGAVNVFLGGGGQDTVVAGDGQAMAYGEADADALTGGASADTLDGGAGDDVLTGGGGNDVLSGGADLDTASYAATLTAADFQAGDTSWTLVAEAEGTDKLDGVEIVTDGGGARFLLVGAGGFASIGAALAAAEEGDTILLAAGTYAESLTIDKAVTILGPNSGIAGNGARGGEAVITGLSQVTAAAGEVVISGVEFRYTGAANTLLGSMNGGALLQLTGGATVTVEDSRFYTDTAQGNADGGGGGRAVLLPTSFSGSATFADNFFGGEVDDNAYGGANWQRGIWSDGSASSLEIIGNSFDWVRTALNLDGYVDAATTVFGNSFSNSGSGISIGVGGQSAPIGINGNQFTNVGTEFNFQNLTTPIVFAVAGNTLVPGGDPLDSAIRVLGGSDDDWLTGGMASDYISGRDGDDLLVGGAGADTLDGGNGIDAVDYSDSAEGLFIDLSTGKQAVLSAPDVAVDSLVGIEVVNGSEQGDFIYGDGQKNTLLGGDGDDVLDGEAGDDLILGGLGADEISGGEGFDLAGYGQDTVGVTVSLASGVGLGGAAEGDQLFDFEGLLGGSGTDSLTGDEAANLLSGDEGADTLTGAGGADSLVGGCGNDLLLGGAGGDSLVGGDGFDTVSYAGSASVTVSLASGLGIGGHSAGDTLSGVEAVIGGNGSDLLTGDALDNALSGEGGNDVLTGGDGNDTLTGGLGNDQLNGGAGADRLTGGAGKDTLTGGSGADSFVWTAASDSLATAAGRDVVVDWGQEDVVDLSGFDANIVLADAQSFIYRGVTANANDAKAGELWSYQFGGNTFLVGGVDGDAARDFQIQLNGLHSFQGTNFDGVRLSLTGTSGSDTLLGGELNDTLAGGGGEDLIVGGLGRDSLAGGGGNDVFVWNSVEESQPTGGGRDVITDFNLGDLIDLSGIDADAILDGEQSFVFGGLAADMNNVAVGEVYYYQFSGRTFVIAGVDADAERDFQIELSGSRTLTAADFVL
ncbi:hypothetical protein [Falsiroseomonas sp.]|uniref:calcium-binding protein n=1 Tax=Falsiroseomonas sp. TaxID=2870721 RepID=UPI003F722A65